VTRLVIFHPEKDFLTSIIGSVQVWLREELQLELHPRKRYLQPYEKGVRFLGAVIKPYRIYIDKRIKANAWQSIQQHNRKIRRDRRLNRADALKMQSSVNSYMGIMKHYHTYKLRKKILGELLSGYCFNMFSIGGGYTRLTRRNRTLPTSSARFIK